MLILRNQWLKIIMHEEDQHTFNINVSNFYSKKIGTYPIVKRWLIPNNKNVWECPKTETDLPILHITFDVQKGSPREQCRPTMELYEVNFNRLKKKSNTCNFIMVINRLMAVLNFPNRSHLPLKTTVETYTVQHRYTNALSAAISMHRQRWGTLG